jgi:hypothetical protein
MLTLQLTPEEVEQLRLILESYLADLRLEVRETDSRSFRANLLAREEFLKKLLRALAVEQA